MIRPTNIYRHGLVKLFLLYLFAVSLISLLIPFAYLVFFQHSPSEWIRMLNGAFSAGFNLESFKGAIPSKLKDDPSAVIFVLLFINAITILVLNMMFQAVLTAKLIRPSINVRTSKSAVFNPEYGLTKTPHILFRLVNASAFDLYSVSLRAFLTVHDEHPDAPAESMTYYFPIEKIDPLDIPVLKSFSPWIVAIPVDVILQNSIIDAYELRLPQPHGSHPGKRELEILITGMEIAASSNFIEAIRIPLELNDTGTGLICGNFVSLPSVMKKDQLGELNKRQNAATQATNAPCAECQFSANCRFTR
jgi:hypothetical protein